MVSISNWLEFHQNLPMFDRFEVIYFHTDNPCDVAKFVGHISDKNAVATQPADVLQVNGQFWENKDLVEYKSDK